MKSFRDTFQVFVTNNPTEWTFDIKIGQVSTCCHFCLRVSLSSSNADFAENWKYCTLPSSFPCLVLLKKLKVLHHCITEPQTEDLDKVVMYLSQLAQDRNLERVDLLLRSLQRYTPLYKMAHYILCRPSKRQNMGSLSYYETKPRKSLGGEGTHCSIIYYILIIFSTAVRPTTSKTWVDS